MFPAADWQKENSYLSTRFQKAQPKRKDLIVKKAIDLCWYILPYKEHEIREMFEKVKRSFEYDRLYECTELIARVYTQLQEMGYTIDYIIPVSDSYRRLSWRGFSVTRQLTAQLPREKVVFAFQHVSDTIEFATLNQAERRNCHLPIVCFPDIRNRIPAGSTILLIDDIVTTGSTLSQHAQLLKKKLATKNIYCLTLCG